MPSITGGRVVYGRTVQPAQYESKKAEVELTFGVEEGGDLGGFLDETAALAMAKAHEMVGMKSEAKKPAPKAPPQTATATAPQGQKEAAAAKMNAKDKAAPKDEIDLGDTKPAISTGEERIDPDGLDLGPAPLTDKDLLEVVSAKMREINNPKAIKDVREKYVKVPMGIKDIPQDKRAAFIADVKALK